MSSLVKMLIEEAQTSNKSQVEFKICKDNKKQVLPLFREFKKRGYSPEIEERNNESYLIVNIGYQENKSSNVIDLNLKENKAIVIPVDFVNKRRL